MKANKTINISLWVAQGLLAAMFLMAGIMKLTQPIDILSVSVPWVTDVPQMLVRFIGFSELLGGIGLLLPAILRIRPRLTAWAAAGLAIIQILAIPFHISRGESSVIGMNIILMLVAIFIAWGRFKKAPIQPK